jgi:hypothetical protein
MVNVEVGFGTFEEASKHMDGLDAIVNMRGGIEILEPVMSGIVVRLVGWNDLNYSERFSKRLRYQKRYVWDRQHDQMDGPYLRKELTALGASEPKVWEPLQGDVIIIFNKLRQMCDREQQMPLKALDEMDKMIRADVFHSLERRLRWLSLRPDDSLNPGTRDTVWRALASAGLIYCHHVLRGLTLAYKQFDTLVHELQVALQSTGKTLESWRLVPELLIWALSIGVVVAAGRRERGSQWFAHRLAEAASAYGCATWQRYHDLLADFLWVGQSDELRYSTVWSEIQAKV